VSFVEVGGKVLERLSNRIEIEHKNHDRRIRNADQLREGAVEVLERMNRRERSARGESEKGTEREGVL